MASRNRHSIARSAASRPSVPPTPGRNASTADELPPYKEPSHPLDAEAIRTLRELQGRNITEVKRHNKQATDTITSTAESINDMLHEHTLYLERRQKKWDVGKSLDDKKEEERAMEDLQRRVDEATAKLEESMRAVIDSSTAAQRIDNTLDWLRQTAPRQLEDEYQTQMTHRATQRQSQGQTESQRRRSQVSDDEDNSPEDAPTPGPTPLDGSRVALTGASEMFTTRMQREKDAYTKLSLTARYARNNDYRDFKRIVHDAKYGDSGPALGHEDTWFTEAGSPAPGITNTLHRGGFGDDDDDDVVIDKATISTTCPLTYQKFKEPYTSIKCPHTFEKNAIFEMIRLKPRGPSGKKEIECPIPGCGKYLTLDDFRTDAIIVRKIRRILQAEREATEESFDDEAQSDDNITSAPMLQNPST